MIRRAAMRSSALGLVVVVTLFLAAVPAEADAALRVHPHDGPPGTMIHVRGSGFPTRDSCPIVVVHFTDSAGVTTWLNETNIHTDGTFHLPAQIPSDAALGRGRVTARKLALIRGRCRHTDASASRSFLVTS